MTSNSRHTLVRSLTVIACAVVFTLGASAVSAVECVVTRIDGQEFSGTLKSWDQAGVALAIEDQIANIQSAELVRIDWSQASGRQTETLLELVDGTRLPHSTFAVQARQANVQTTLQAQPLELTTEQIRWVQLLPNASWQELFKSELAGDAILVRRKDSLSGDVLSGVLGDIGTDKVSFTWDGETIPVNRAKVTALAYFHARLPQFPAPICMLHLTDGSRLPVASLKAAGSKILVTTVAGLTFEISLAKITQADYSLGKIAYLSDLQPIVEKWTPQIGLPAAASIIQQYGTPRRDQSFSGSALTLLWPGKQQGGLDSSIKTYRKGLAVRSRTELRYRLPSGMTRFAALAGIDPETAREGDVQLEVFADRRPLWQGRITGGETPESINVQLGNARELRIVVDYGENLDYGDRLHLVQARVTK